MLSQQTDIGSLGEPAMGKLCIGPVPGDQRMSSCLGGGSCVLGGGGFGGSIGFCCLP